MIEICDGNGVARTQYIGLTTQELWKRIYQHLTKAYKRYIRPSIKDPKKLSVADELATSVSSPSPNIKLFFSFWPPILKLEYLLPIMVTLKKKLLIYNHSSLQQKRILLKYLGLSRMVQIKLSGQKNVLIMEHLTCVQTLKKFEAIAPLLTLFNTSFI